jgi:Glycosyl transferase family 2
LLSSRAVDEPDAIKNQGEWEHKVSAATSARARSRANIFHVMPTIPVLTVVLIAGNCRERVQRVLQSVLEQDIADQIVIMVYDRADQPARDLPELNRSNIVYEVVDKGCTQGPLQKYATLAATTDIIAFIEEHVVVPPGWARESLRRHAEGYAGVTGIFVAGNPHHRWARILFSITYGNYMLSSQAGETTEIPGDNSSFIRSKISKYGDELDALLSTDILLIRRLTADGEKLYRAADLIVKHWGEDRFSDGWMALFYWNQMYICNLVTVERWSLTHRGLRLLSTPLAPFVRTLKSYRHAKRNASDMKQFFADLPVSFLFHVGSAAGMAAGILLGYQDSERKFTDCETNAQRPD